MRDKSWRIKTAIIQAMIYIIFNPLIRQGL